MMLRCGSSTAEKREQRINYIKALVLKTKNVAKNFVMMFGGSVIGQLFFFFGLAHLARVLGPSGFGAWNFAQVVMLYLLRGSEFGLETIGVRETARDLVSIPTWIATIVSTRFVLGSLLLICTLLAALADLFPGGTTSLVLISALCVLPISFTLEWVFEARQEVGLISIARILKGVTFFVAVFLLTSSGDDAQKAGYFYFGSVSLSMLIVTVVALQRFGIDLPSLSFQKSFSVLRKAGPLGIASILSQYSLFASTIVVGYFLARDQLGYFTAANRIVMFLWAYVITSMHRSLLPSLSSTYHNSLSEYRRVVVGLFRLSTLAAVPIGLMGTLCATPLMKLLYSSQYEVSGAVFGILLCGFVLANIRSILEIALIASDRQRQYMRGMVLLAILYTVLTTVLTLRFGIVGAAIAVLSSETCYFGYLVYTCPYSEPVTLLKHSWKPITAAAIALASLVPLDIHPLLRLVFGLTIFAAVLVALKGVSAKDSGLFKSLFRFGGESAA